MKQNIEIEELELFRDSIKKVKAIKQDTVVHQKIVQPKIILNEKQKQENIHNEFYFSDIFQPLLKEDPICYLKENANPTELKKLKRGFYEPDFFLDLHGLNQQNAKKEISALISACLRERAPCASIMYGHGKNILKKQVPMWLAQHPDILCFHQAPKEFGGAAALLILFSIQEQDFTTLLR